MKPQLGEKVKGKMLTLGKNRNSKRISGSTASEAANSERGQVGGSVMGEA